MTVTTQQATAVDTLPIPECENPKTGATLPTDLPDQYLPILYFRNGETRSCDNGIFQYIDSSKAYTITIAPRDEGWRLWYANLATGISYQSINKIPEVGDGVSDNGFSFSTGSNYAIAILSGGALTASQAAIILQPSESVAVLQLSPVDSINATSAMPILNGNGGNWGGETIRTPKMKSTELTAWTTANTPTRAGYQFKNWSTDAAGQHPVDANTTVTVGTYLYAQWEKSAGDPQSADLDCSTGGRCELTVNYSGTTAKTREFQPGSGDLAWSGTPIAGIRLDANGYKADGACSDARCWYVSLDKEPSQQSSYQAQMPTTGAPEGLSTVGLVAVGLGLIGLAFAMAMRDRS